MEREVREKGENVEGMHERGEKGEIREKERREM